MYKLLRQDLETQGLVGNRPEQVPIKKKSRLVKNIARIGSEFDMLTNFVVELTQVTDAATEHNQNCQSIITLKTMILIE